MTKEDYDIEVAKEYTTLQERIATLEKENAELRKELKEWKDEWQEQVQKATDEGYARTLQTMQLTKAKDKLKRIKNIFYNGETNDRRLVQIGDILSEVEK
jgi:cell division septum initiation protein DivIVA